MFKEIIVNFTVQGVAKNSLENKKLYLLFCIHFKSDNCWLDFVRFSEISPFSFDLVSLRQKDKTK